MRSLIIKLESKNKKFILDRDLSSKSDHKNLDLRLLTYLKYT